jgi:peptidyl-prolyl cis-trans isomerase D
MIRFLQTPGPIKKVILSGILLIFCGAMVITLIPGGLGNELLGQPAKGVVAKVSGEDITVLEVQREARLMLRQQLPQGMDPGRFIPMVARSAANRLITQQTAIAEAQRLGLKATTQDVQDELQHGRYAPFLFPGGKFIGQEAYENLLAQNGTNWQDFEKGVRAEILQQKLATLVTGSATVSDAEVRSEFQKRNAKVKFEYAVLSQDDIRKGLHPSDAELKAFYEQNKATYANSIPEKRKLEYVFVDRTKLLAQVPVSHEELQSYYDQHRDQYRVAEQVKVSHILIKTPPPGPDGKVDEKAVEEARKKAEDILKQLKAGAKFEDLAKKNSDDPGSAKQGGELGWIGRGRTVPEFEKVAFSLPKGQTSDLVKSTYGFHIIRVEDKQDAHVKTLDEVKDQIETLVKQEKASRLAQSQADALLTQARNVGLDKAATAKNLNVVTTDFVAKTDALPGIGVTPQFTDAVFAAQEKAPPDLVQLPQGYAVYQVLGIKPPSTPSFDEIRSRVENEFKNQRASLLLSQKTQELSDRAKAEHDLKKAAKELGATLKTSEFVLPNGQVPDIGSMTNAEVAFTMKPGEISGPISAGTNGVVLSLLEKQEPTDQEFAAQKDSIRDSLLQAKRQELFGLFLSNLQTQMQKSGKIRINEQELNNLTRGQGGGEEGF